MCLNPPDPHDFNPSLSVCLFGFLSPVLPITVTLFSALPLTVMIFSSSPSVFFSLYFLNCASFPFFHFLHSYNSSSSLFHPPLALPSLHFSPPLFTDHNRPETSVYRQSHRDIGLGSHGCCHYCSGPRGKVRST